MLVILIILIFNITDYISIISYVNHKDKEALHGEYNITKDAAKSIGNGMNTIGQGISTVGSQLGLGATMVGVSTAVAKGVAKSGMPPMQKAGVIVGGAVSPGFAHAIVSAYSRNAVRESTPSYISKHINSNANRFIDDYPWSPLQILLFSLSAVCLSLIVILLIQIIYKFYLKENIKLNLTSVISIYFNNTIEYYLNKMIFFNKKWVLYIYD